MTDTKEMPGEIAVYKRTDAKFEFAEYDTPLNHEWTKYIRADRYAQNLITETKALRDLLDAKEEDTTHFPAADLERVREKLVPLRDWMTRLKDQAITQSKDLRFEGLAKSCASDAKQYTKAEKALNEVLQLLERKEKT